MMRARRAPEKPRFSPGGVLAAQPSVPPVADLGAVAGGEAKRRPALHRIVPELQARQFVAKQHDRPHPDGDIDGDRHVESVTPSPESEDMRADEVVVADDVEGEAADHGTRPSRHSPTSTAPARNPA